ncbi:hypothetical protein AM593_03719, partial [Mytilus galloprovincialis]
LRTVIEKPNKSTGSAHGKNHLMGNLTYLAEGALKELERTIDYFHMNNEIALLVSEYGTFSKLPHCTEDQQSFDIDLPDLPKQDEIENSFYDVPYMTKKYLRRETIVLGTIPSVLKSMIDELVEETVYKFIDQVDDKLKSNDKVN